MLGYWISFALILILVPIGLVGLIIWQEKKNRFSDSRKKTVRLGTIKFCLFYWLCALFYMSCFISSLICKYVFGVTVLIFIFADLAMAFRSLKTKNGLDRFGTIQDSLVGIGMTIYLIYIIPDSSLQTIITAVAAAVYGGLITLVGVGWTIKRSDEVRKSDEIVKATPVFSFNPCFKVSTTDGSTKMCYTSVNYAAELSCLMRVEIENSDKSFFTFDKVFHDGQWYPLEGNKTVLPSGECFFSFYFSSMSNIFLSIIDALGNEHLYSLKVFEKVVLDENASTSKFANGNRLICTLKEIEEISKEQFHNLVDKAKLKEAVKNGTK